jgi:endothelin-converting enzyme/putative endopeptidase
MNLRWMVLALTVSACLCPLHAQTTAARPAPRVPRPLTELPYTPGVDLSALDRTVDPCVDLYAYACGGWKRNNPVPPDQARWSVYSKVQDENEQFLWGLLVAASDTTRTRTASEQKIGDYFAACMDEAAAEAAGAGPLQADLTAIAALDSKAALAALLARLHAEGSGALFGFGSYQDMRDSSQVIAWASAGGLGLPDRDYYVQDAADKRALREKYEAHIARSLRLVGDAPEVAARAAADVLRIETTLAQHTLTRVERRDPRKLDNPKSVAELQALVPSFRWSDYLAASKLSITRLNVTEPEFYRGLEALLVGEQLPALRNYLRWQLVRGASQYLSKPFVEAAFDFYGRTLRGTAEPTPRFKRCVRWVDRDLGEALGQVFVEKTFPPTVKQRALDMVVRIEAAMQARLQALPWMGAETKRQALVKLHAMRNKIGYPERWRDYGALEVRRGDLLGNVTRAQAFETRRQLGKIGQPVDKGEWQMTPPTVNAYYDPTMNDMNFPAGVLQPPLFDAKMDDAPNYGNTGGTIGHELIHGFDDEGRRFDAQGNLRDWWTDQDAREFERRAQCIVDQYAQYTVVDDIKINSKLTLGEDVADLAGLILAWDAWRAATAGQKLQARDGLTPEQRFFVGFAQWTCENERDENKRLNAVTNPHSPGQYRINGVVVNMPEYATAFACKAGQPMAKPAEQVCRVW